MNMHQLRKLIEAVEESGVIEIEVADDDETIRIGRHNGAGSIPASTNPPTIAVLNTADVASPAKASNGMLDSYIVRAPMVGTFYRAPAPDAKPLVEVGDTVSGNEALCIIEALKIQNHIRARIPGKVTAVLVEDAEPVEYDQALFVVSQPQNMC